ncbi:MAG: lysophospholipid acyltransferase family protein [Gallionella sp.]
MLIINIKLQRYSLAASQADYSVAPTNPKNALDISMIPLPIIGLFRAIRTALHLIYGLAIALVFPRLKSARRRRVMRQWSLELLAILNVHIDVKNTLYALKPGIVVTNHISWLDIFVLNAIVPMRFVAKSEVRLWPLIGWLCMRVQTLFIERGRARDAARINLHVVELLKEGECLAVFPEGTTTDGTRVGIFHASLLQPAVDAGAQVHPIALRYQDAQGKHSLAAAYIDDLSLGASLWQIFTCPSLHVQLLATPTLEAAGSDRRTLTRLAHQQVIRAVSHMHAEAALATSQHSATPHPPSLSPQVISDQTL